MSFQWPFALIGLIAVPLAVAGYVLHQRRRDGVAARFSSLALLPNVVHEAPGRRRHLPLAILLVALTAMVIGVARPHATISVPREEATVMIIVDRSLSMTSDDVRPTRLDAARAAASAFLRKVPEKFRVGVISFAGRALVNLPPTTDRALADAALASLRPGEGTAVSDAIVLAIRLGRQQRSSDGTIPPTAVLLISDGAQTSGSTSPAAAAERARAFHVPVYSLVVGTPDGVITTTVAGGFRQIMRVPIRPDTLRRLSSTTNAEVFTAPRDPRLGVVYEKLGSRLGHKRQLREITDFFAGGSAALLLAGGMLSAFWFRRVP